MSTTDGPQLDSDASQTTGTNSLLGSEDWWAVWIGGGLLAFCLASVLVAGSADAPANPLKSWLAKPGSWSSNPIDSIFVAGESNSIQGVVGVLVVSSVAFGLCSLVM